MQDYWYQVKLLKIIRAGLITDRKLGWPFRATTDTYDLFGNDQ